MQPDSTIETAPALLQADLNGAEDGTRTRDLLITNQLLYQLSYFGVYEGKQRILAHLSPSSLTPFCIPRQTGIRVRIRFPLPLASLCALCSRRQVDSPTPRLPGVMCRLLQRRTIVLEVICSRLGGRKAARFESMPAQSLRRRPLKNHFGNAPAV